MREAIAPAPGFLVLSRAARVAPAVVEPARLRVRRARSADIPELEAFVAHFTPDGSLLPRSRANLVTHIADFRIVRAGGAIVGAGALQRVNAELAEIRSVAVDPAAQGQGLGTRIVKSLVADARRLGLGRVFCLTRRTHFFGRLGFVAVPMDRFPHKVWNDCRMCPRQACCDETAMERSVTPARKAARFRLDVHE